MKYTVTLGLVMLLINISIGQNDNWKLFPATQKEVKATNINIADTTQVRKELDFEHSKQGNVTVVQPEYIDSLTSYHKDNPFVLGYTIQLEVSQQNSKIRDARYKILKVKPDIIVEEAYIAPNTYLYGGVFYTRTDAYAFKNAIKNEFPNAIVIAKKMPLPPLESISTQTSNE